MFNFIQTINSKPILRNVKLFQSIKIDNMLEASCKLFLDYTIKLKIEALNLWLFQALNELVDVFSNTCSNQLNVFKIGQSHNDITQDRIRCFILYGSSIYFQLFKSVNEVRLFLVFEFFEESKKGLQDEVSTDHTCDTQALQHSHI